MNTKKLALTATVIAGTVLGGVYASAAIIQAQTNTATGVNATKPAVPSAMMGDEDTEGTDQKERETHINKEDDMMVHPVLATTSAPMRIREHAPESGDIRPMYATTSAPLPLREKEETRLRIYNEDASNTPELRREQIENNIRLYTNATTTAAQARTQLKERIDQVKQDALARKEQLQQQIEERKQVIEEHRASTTAAAQARIDGKRQDLIKAYADRMVERLHAATDRLNVIADRIDSRIQKIEEAGVDMSVASDLLIQARAEIDVAKVAVENIPLSIDQTIISSDPTQTFADTRGVTTEATNSIKTAHSALVQVVEMIKKGLAGTNTDASATTTTSSN